MAIVHLDGRYFTNMADLINIRIHHVESLFFNFTAIITELLAKLATQRGFQ